MVTRLCLLRTQKKGCDFSMGIYTEKRDQLIEKIKGLEKRIASDTAKKKTLEDKLKEVSRLAMAEEYFRLLSGRTARSCSVPVLPGPQG